MPKVDFKKPLVSKRFCAFCRDMTTFKLNKYEGHSECEICFGRFSFESRRHWEFYMGSLKKKMQ